MHYVYTSVENNVAIIEFSSEQANALSMDLLHRLAKELDAASVNDSVKVVLLKSAGEKTFCAGAFFDELVKKSKFFSICINSLISISLKTNKLNQSVLIHNHS